MHCIISASAAWDGFWHILHAHTLPCPSASFADTTTRAATTAIAHSSFEVRILGRHREGSIAVRTRQTDGVYLGVCQEADGQQPRHTHPPQVLLPPACAALPQRPEHNAQQPRGAREPRRTSPAGSARRNARCDRAYACAPRTAGARMHQARASHENAVTSA